MGPRRAPKLGTTDAIRVLVQYAEEVYYAKEYVPIVAWGGLPRVLCVLRPLKK